MTNCGDRAVEQLRTAPSFASWIQVLIASSLRKKPEQSQISRCSCPGRVFLASGPYPLRVELFDVELPLFGAVGDVARNAESAGPRLMTPERTKMDHLRCGGRAHPTVFARGVPVDILFAFTISMAN